MRTTRVQEYSLSGPGVAGSRGQWMATNSVPSRVSTIELGGGYAYAGGGGGETSSNCRAAGHSSAKAGLPTVPHAHITTKATRSNRKPASGERTLLRTRASGRWSAAFCTTCMKRCPNGYPGWRGGGMCTLRSRATERTLVRGVRPRLGAHRGEDAAGRLRRIPRRLLARPPRPWVAYRLPRAEHGVGGARGRAHQPHLA